MQHELHTKAVQILQAASTERDLTQRLRILQQASDLLLHADTSAELVASCLPFFTSLQNDPQTSIRRYAAYFVGRAAFFKPSLALRLLPSVAALLEDGDSVVKELAAKAAVTLHRRSLFSLCFQSDGQDFPKHVERMHKIEDVMLNILQNQADSPAFRFAAQWAKVVVLSQTPSPLVLAVRVPAELRGINCLQDFPEKTSMYMDLDALRQQAEDIFATLCTLLVKPPSGVWGVEPLRSLMQCIGSIARQRPACCESALRAFRQLLESPAAPIQVNKLLLGEARLLLASNVSAEHRTDVLELLAAAGFSGTLEDLLVQSKYQHLCEQLDDSAVVEPKTKKLRRTEVKRVWAGNAPADEGILASEDAFDADALLAGEAEVASRRFEDYFGLPSQREPAGHVPAPALLASRTPSNAELARIALTSLNSLTLKRSLMRSRAHERIVALDEAPAMRGPSAKAELDSSKEAHSDMTDLALFLAESTSTSNGGNNDGEGAAVGGPHTQQFRDPRSRLAKARSALLQEDSLLLGGKNGNGQSLGAAKNGNQGGIMSKGDLGGDAAFLAPLEASTAKLPTDAAGCDALENLIFEEVLQAQQRLEQSPYSVALTSAQLESFGKVSHQLALHLATGSRHFGNPALQRTLCKAFMQKAFHKLKTALTALASAQAEQPGKPPDASLEAAVKAALGNLVDLFFAKFNTDLARWQQEHAGANTASVVATQTPLQEILDAKGGDRRTVFTYAELFGLFITEFERLQLPKRELRSFLNEIPVVPMQAFKMLEAQCLVAGTRKMALLTVLSLLESKPSARWHGLRLLFWLAYSGNEDSSVRFDTIRLTINKIFSPGPRAPMRWQLPHLSEKEVAPLVATAENGGHNWDLDDGEYLPLQLLKGRCVEDLATVMLRSIAAADAKFAHPVKGASQLETLRSNLFKGSVCAPKDRVWLYLALCIKRPVLLHGLVETFSQCQQDMKEHLINSIEEALKYIPPSEPELLTLVKKAAPETEPLVIKMLHILVQTSRGKEQLSNEYGAAACRLYNITNNARLLVPVFDLIDRKSLLDFLPAVMMLEESEVTIAFQQFVRSKNPPLSIAELITELHHMNSPSENVVPVKASMQALNIIFSMRDQFDTKVYGIVVQALVEESGPLPTLFMRSVIQVVKEVPRLSDFLVMQILPRLVRQEVWGSDQLWKGFMLVLQHTFDSQSGGAARVLAMLPMSQLEDVLVQHPDWKNHLRDYVARQPAGGVAPHVRQLLQ